MKQKVVDYKDWFDKKQEILQGKIKHKMSDTYAESSMLTGGRPSSATFCLTNADGLSLLRAEIILLLNDSYEIFPKTIENIEIINRKISGVLSQCIDFIFNAYPNNYSIGINSAKTMINEIEMDIYKLIETQKINVKSQKKHDAIDTIWRIIPILISLIAVGISCLK